MLDGVCGGIAEYFRVDAFAVRLLLLALIVLSIGAGVIFYIAAMITMPMKPMPAEAAVDIDAIRSGSKSATAASSTLTLLFGVIVIIIGVTLLFDYYGMFSITSMLHSVGKLLLPVIFILIGGSLLLGRDHGDAMRRVAKADDEETHGGAIHQFDVTAHTVQAGKLFRPNDDKKISGVCGAFANYFEVDSTVVRLIFASLIFASFGLALILYIACALVIPREDRIAADRDQIGHSGAGIDP